MAKYKGKREKLEFELPYRATPLFVLDPVHAEEQNILQTIRNGQDLIEKNTGNFPKHVALGENLWQALSTATREDLLTSITVEVNGEILNPGFVDETD